MTRSLTSRLSISSPRLQLAIGAAAIIVVVLVAYSPTFTAGYIWDDDVYLLENPQVTGSRPFWDIWIGRPNMSYYPLTTACFWIEWRLWKDWSTGYHVVNILIHALGSILVWRLLRYMQFRGAWWAAMIFAIHPVNVESVAWVSELKNVLTLPFFLLSIWSYLRYDQSQSRAWYCISVAMFVVALCAKTAVVMLPLLLLVLLWWKHGKIAPAQWLSTTSYFAISAFLGAVTLYFENTLPLVGPPVRPEGVLSRLAASAWAIWFYMYKAILPIHLSPIYPRWTVDPSSVMAWLPAIALIACLGTLLRLRKAWGRPLFTAALCYIVMLLPLLGFLNTGMFRMSLVTDHWQYFALIVPIIVIVSPWVRAQEARSLAFRRVGQYTMVFVTAILGGLTWQYCHSFRDMESWARTAIAGNPQAGVAFANLGSVLARRGEIEAAIDCYQEAVQKCPSDSLPAHTSLTNLFWINRDFSNAVRHAAAAVELVPTDVEIRHKLAVGLWTIGQPAAALQHFEWIGQASPDYPGIDAQTGLCWLAMGKPAQAISHLRQAVSRKPQNAEFHFDLATAFSACRRLDEAIEQYRTAIHLRPAYVEAHTNLAVLLAQSCLFDEAKSHYQQAIQLDPHNVIPRLGLARILSVEGHMDAAIEQYKVSVTAQPQRADICRELRNLLLQAGRGGEAIASHQQTEKLRR